MFDIPTALAQVSAGAVTDETSTQLQGIVEFFVFKIPSFIAAIVVFVVFFFLSKIIKGIVVGKVTKSFEEHKEIQILAGRTASASTLIIGATIALNIAGIDLTVIIAAAGFGVGFALKDIIINFFAGFMILAQKQFTIGDYINIEGTIGQITEIMARATILKALDGTKVVVPNSELFMKQVISYTSNPFRRIEIVVGVEYNTDLSYAVQTCYNALKKTEGVLIEPAPAVLVDEFSDSSINLIVRAWVESKGSWLQVRSNLAQSIKAEFDSVNINIPFPIRTIVYDKDVKDEIAKDPSKQPAWLKNPQPQQEMVAEAVTPQGQTVDVNVGQAPVPPSTPEPEQQTQPEQPAAQPSEAVKPKAEVEQGGAAFIAAANQPAEQEGKQQ